MDDASALALGRSGEEAAAVFLKKSGYRIVCKNYRTPFAEIDIIAREKDVLCFVEVKTRTTSCCGSPAEALSPRKQQHITQAALWYLQQANAFQAKARFDVVSVVATRNFKKCTLIRNAFELSSPYTY